MNVNQREENGTIDYSTWSQHRADNGLIYLSHPVSGAVKWLWSRHKDPNSQNDYLVNTVTGERYWVTKQNEHLCPVKLQQREQQLQKKSLLQKQKNASTVIPPIPVGGGKATVVHDANVALTIDELLMQVNQTGRRYIFNKKTKTSRWLPSSSSVNNTATPQQQQMKAEHKPTFHKTNNSMNNINNPYAARQQQPQQQKQVEHKSTFNTTTNNTNNTNDNNSNPYAAREPSTSIKTTETMKSARKHFEQLEINSTRAAATTEQKEEEREEMNEEIQGKMKMLTDVLEHIEKITEDGRFRIKSLEKSIDDVDITHESTEGIETKQRLLELNEFLTQQMLKVDGVESEGNRLVRAKRKQVVTAILYFIDYTETLTSRLKKKK